MGKKGLQIATALLCVIPVTTGLMALSFSVRFPIFGLTSGPVSPSLDSDFRYFGGLWLGVGLAGFWLIPTIERQTVLFRAIWGAIFLGGIGRIISMFVFGLPVPAFTFFTVLEVALAPAFVYWQHRVAIAASQNQGVPAIEHDGASGHEFEPVREEGG
jgi:hypothetical protein